jgi:hypothetical protein
MTLFTFSTNFETLPAGAMSPTWKQSETVFLDGFDVQYEQAKENKAFRL